LKFARRLDDPVTLATVLDALVVEPSLRAPPPNALLDGGQMTLLEFVAMLNAWKAALTAPKIVLYTNPLTPTPNTVIGDLTQPTASWYTAPSAVIGSAYANSDGTVELTTVSHQFQYSGADPATTIYGWGITDTV
jgi:hypothetical protein